MSKGSMKDFIKHAEIWTTKHSPEILTGLGITGMFSMTVMAVKATPKAIRLIEEKKREEQVDALSVGETIKVAWKPYIPVALTGIFSTACLIGANSVNSRRNAALAAAYKLSETALAEYKEKVVETLGEKKEKEVRDKVAKSKVENNPPKSNEVILTGKGKTLCFEVISGRYFESDIDTIKQVENKINHKLLRNDTLSLSEFYYELGLTATSISDDMGWRVDNGLINLYFSSQLTPEGEPCVVIDYETLPRYGYNEYY